jgi:hypothetical protein
MCKCKQYVMVTGRHTPACQYTRPLTFSNGCEILHINSQPSEIAHLEAQNPSPLHQMVYYLDVSPALRKDQSRQNCSHQKSVWCFTVAEIGLLFLTFVNCKNMPVGSHDGHENLSKPENDVAYAVGPLKRVFMSWSSMDLFQQASP